MVVENLTGKQFSPEDAARLAISVGARVSTGTDMSVLSSVIASDFKLKLLTTNRVDVLTERLYDGAVAIVNVGGDRAGYKGIFSDGGHYIVAAGMYKDKVIIADSNMYDGKYSFLYRKKVVEVIGNCLLASPETVDKDASNRSPRYYIFSK